MKPQDCKKRESCSAPLCPMEEKIENLNLIWYPISDEICKNKDYSNLGWIKSQKKIAKKAKDESKYFNFRMLNRNCRITKGITGLDPEKDEGPQLKKWLALHPTQKKMSLAQRKAVGERFQKYRQLKEK